VLLRAASFLCCSFVIVFMALGFYLLLILFINSFTLRICSAVAFFIRSNSSFVYFMALWFRFDTKILFFNTPCQVFSVEIYALFR
jgi:hypothetical protein